MEHKFSFNKPLRDQITARVVMNGENKMIEVNIDENNKKLYDVDREIRTTQKAIRRRRQKNREYQPPTSRLKEVKNFSTDLKYKIHPLN